MFSWDTAVEVQGFPQLENALKKRDSCCCLILFPWLFLFISGLSACHTWKGIVNNALNESLDAFHFCPIGVKEKKHTNISAGILAQTKARLLQTSFDQYTVGVCHHFFMCFMWFPDGALSARRCSNWGPAFKNLKRGERGREGKRQSARQPELGNPKSIWTKKTKPK